MAVACCGAWWPLAATGQSAGCIALVETVIDERSRVPLAGARVTGAWAGHVSPEVRSDSLGRATLCVPPHQTLTIRVTYADRTATWQTSLSDRPSQHTSTLDVPASFVRGRVIDDHSGDAIAHAHVRVANTALQTTSDAEGRFFFERIPIGSYAFSVQHLGYTGHRAAVQVEGDDLDAVIRIAPAAIPLQPIVVSVFSRRLDAVGFYERRKRGIGTFIDRKRIDAMNVEAASDLLRLVPGMRLVPQSRTRLNQLRNATVGGRGNCRFVFIVDGARTLSDFEMDYIAGPAIEGVEIYNGMADVPAAFKAHATSVAGSTVCGVIAVWTRNSR